MFHYFQIANIWMGIYSLEEILKQNNNDLQNPDGVGGPRALLPPGDDNDVVPGSDEVAPLAEVDGVLHPVVDVLHPVGLALLLVEERDAASEDLHLPCHLSIPGQIFNHPAEDYKHNLPTL